ncbi:MAG: 23S rRNA (uracil(1939)-C(5))-methyltransferase RlmD, partial [Parasporobacterium sp.]|nr:23S rRNA (uracil(1939)-C(5))-methyltransferase RlmD [Parasporobacterium sp.]
MIRKNDRIRLKISDMGINGEGIGKFYDPDEGHNGSGFTFFVKNAVIGDEVLAVVTGLKKGYGYAKVLEIIEASPDRVKPACPLAERCGGCQIMQLSYDAQLKFKENKVRNDLERLGGQHCDNFLPIKGMKGDMPLHFRNKMQFPVGWDKEGHVVTGFYAGRTHYIIGTADCPVSPEINNIILEAVRCFAEKFRLSSYNEETGTGLIRHVLIRNAFHTGQIMVCLVINGDELEHSNHLVRDLTALKLEEPWRIASICLNINKEQTNVILGEKVECIYGNPYIEEMIVSSLEGMKPLTFRVNPLSFFQTNPYQTSVLYDEALKMAGLTGSETVWDLYCGAGT